MDVFNPLSVIILGKVYSITYVDKPSEVDLYKRESFWGQIDFWTQTIRIYDNKTNVESILHTVIHEILHGIASELKLVAFKEQKGHDELDLVALALADVLIRNGWLKENISPEIDDLPFGGC